MADNHNHFQENSSRDFSDETIRRFLLGRLSTTEQPLFEQRLIADDGLDARVSRLAVDLADDYAFGRLGAADQTRFEERFLLTSDRRQVLAVSMALVDRFSAPSEAVMPARSKLDTVAERLRNLPGLNQPAWRIAFGVLILAILFATAWLVIKEPRIAWQFTPKRAPARPTPGAPSEANHPPDKSSAPAHEEVSPPMPVHEPTVLTFVLGSAISPAKDTVATVSLPKDRPEIVRLQLTLPKGQSGVYRAELRAVGGQSVFTAGPIKTGSNDGAKIDFDVPARLLQTGDYQVVLSPDTEGSKESVTSYYFRVE